MEKRKQRDEEEEADDVDGEKEGEEVRMGIKNCQLELLGGDEPNGQAPSKSLPHRSMWYHHRHHRHRGFVSMCLSSHGVCVRACRALRALCEQAHRFGQRSYRAQLLCGRLPRGTALRVRVRAI